MDTVGIVLLGLAMLAGIVGTVLPFIPGLPIVWAAALAYGLAGGFDGAGWVAFPLISVLFVVGMAAGFLLPARKATEAGAPRSTMLVGLLGGIVGFFFVPVIGLPLGAAAGVLVAERSRLGDWGPAWVSTKALIVGFGVGALAQMGAGILMMLLWISWVLVD